MMKQRVASLVFALIAAASVPAAIFVSPVEVTGVEHSFQVFTDPEFAGTAFSYDRFVANHSGFVADLDQDTSLQYTLRAPEGKKFRLDPAGATFNVDLVFNSRFGSIGEIDLAWENPSRAVATEMANGVLLFPGNEVRDFTTRVGDNNQSLHIAGIATSYPGPLEFTGLSLTVNYAPRNTGLGELNFSFVEGSVGFGAFRNSLADPGPILHLVPIPEVSSTFLTGMLILLGVTARKIAISVKGKRGRV
jgi:hypothetical protein